uniref:Uncharacterized protein n=1 Tax=Lepeophtheirus salmonis TaxID=72036 RepID=A0A0K2UAP3_LEPSM
MPDETSKFHILTICCIITNRFFSKGPRLRTSILLCFHLTVRHSGAELFSRTISKSKQERNLKIGWLILVDIKFGLNS